MGTHDGNGIGRMGRMAAAMVLGALTLGTAGMVATAGPADAAQCPPGTVLFAGVLCVRTSTPVTSPPPTTPITVAPPPVALPPVTVPPVLPTPAAPVSAPDAARRLLDLANAERAKAGVDPLASRDDVVAIAQAHSERMAKAGDIFHSESFMGSAVKNLLNVVARGENVAYNGNIESAHARLMASAGHRANILDARFSVAGVGVVRAPDGRYFITQNFIQPAGAPPSTAPRPAPAPRAARPAAAPRPAAPRPAPAAPITTTTSAAPVPETTVPVPTPETVPSFSFVDAAPSAIAATSLPSPTHGVDGSLAAAAIVLLGSVTLGCWLVPRRRS